MADTRAPITAADRFAHGRLLCLLIGSYAIAALWPGPGLRMRDASLGTVTLARDLYCEDGSRRLVRG
jgi:hypothetical protein